MSKARTSLLASLLFYFLVLPAVCVTARSQTAQTPPPADLKMIPRVVLILTPEFCAAKNTKRIPYEDEFEVGKAACVQLEPALKNVFPNLVRVQTASSTGDAELVLAPIFVDISVIKAQFAYTERELVLLVEWTAKDKSGKRVWLQTVQGLAKNTRGTAFTFRENRRLLIQGAVQDLADKSASEMADSPVLRKLARQAAPQAVPTAPPAKAPAAQAP
jgi:hypothetical protein